MSKIKVHELSFSGNMEKVTLDVEDFPEDILEADDWFGPQVGELCISRFTGKLDVVKDIYWGDTRGGMLKPHKIYVLEVSGEKLSSVVRMQVKKGKVFIFNGKPYVHQEALDGGYINKMARGKKIIEYEYETGK